MLFCPSSRQERINLVFDLTSLLLISPYLPSSFSCSVTRQSDTNTGKIEVWNENLLENYWGKAKRNWKLVSNLSILWRHSCVVLIQRIGGSPLATHLPIRSLIPVVRSDGETQNANQDEYL